MSTPQKSAIGRVVRAFIGTALTVFLYGSTDQAPVAAQDQIPQEEPGQVFADPGDSAGERYIVKYKDLDQARNAVRGRRGRVVLELPGRRMLAARLTEDAREALAADASVEYIELDAKRYPMQGPPWQNLSVGGEISPYGIQMVQADQVSSAAAGNRMVCIIDSGFYRAHDDHQYGNVTASPDIGTGDPFVDRSSHGSHVAGTVAAIGGNGVGVRGVFPDQNLRIHIVKVFGDDGVYAYSSTLVAALTQCRNAGANVVSMSLGGPTPSAAELTAFNDAFAAGVLSVAAAGNGGNTAFSYPASYPSVMSVAGVDSNEAHYTSSQQNSEVDIAAPAVAVLSSTSSVNEGTLVVGGTTYRGSPLTESQSSGGTAGVLVVGGLCGAPDPAWAGRVVLCERGGGFSFVQKAQAVQDSTGVAVVIYNNVGGHFTGTLGAGNTITIPGITVSRETGLEAIAFAGEDALVTSLNAAGPAMTGYSFFNGTSMATPHVSAVAALVWSHNPLWTNVQIRGALEATARDIGTAGRDNFFGWGIVQAKAALDFLCPDGCEPDPIDPGPVSMCFADSSEGDFDVSGEGVNVRIAPGNVRLNSTGDPALDQQDVTASTGGFGTTATGWFAQTFTAGVTGQLVRVDLNLFCSGCSGAPPNFVVSIRATANDLPTGPDLATAVIPGFTSGASSWKTFTFATPPAITAGTQYAIVGRPQANPVGTYAYIAAPAATPNTYAGGRRATSTNSGGTWVAAAAGRDINFKTYATGPLPYTFTPTGQMVGSIRDAHPATGFTPRWGTLDWSATTPPGTSIRFQVAAADTAAGPFDFVGPDGTNATFYTSSGGSLSQFDGSRHLRYLAYFETSDPSVTPVLHEVTTCMSTFDAVAPTITGASADQSELWPPNHKMQDINLSYQVADNFDEDPVVTISVTSNEAVDEPGSGNTSPDWEIVSDTMVRLRAERAGTGTGRIYTITITATDATGNTASTSVTVGVPHNK